MARAPFEKTVWKDNVCFTGVLCFQAKDAKTLKFLGFSVAFGKEGEELPYLLGLFCTAENNSWFRWFNNYCDLVFLSDHGSHAGN